MPPSQPPALAPGEWVRLAPGAAPVEVLRVTPCAAYVGRMVRGKPFEAWDKASGAYKTVPGLARMVVEAISVHSLVERVEEGP